MTCDSCEGKKKHSSDGFTKAVIEIDNPETIILFRKVTVPASMGTEEQVPPAIGKYRNVLLLYEANRHTYIYSSDGIPTLLETDVPQEVLDRITELEEGLVDESETRAAADEQLSEAITSERTAREAADAAEAATRAQAISDEASARATADATLQSNIDAIASNLATEAATRANADTALGTRIDGVVSDLATEASIRANADAALGTRIDGVASDLVTETTNRQAADTNLQTAISNEATTRANADTSLQTALSTETTARQTADTGLQSQIDAIVASSDVKDIVGTYAALQQYDTSTLGNNDIIKVLQDETHSDETTYYRWSTTTSTFALIGEEGPYYTKSATDTLLNAKADKSTTYTKTEVDTALATKQGSLTAGTNVQISAQNVISATDTTYSTFTGTDGTSAGASGLVPAPATTDAGKVLGANGSWVTGGPTVVQTTGTSTTDVMSQNAVTSMVFADPSTMEKIKIGAGASVNGDEGIAIGKEASANRRSSLGIGPSSKGSGADSVSIGGNSLASGTGCIAIGSKNGSSGATKAYHDCSIAIGYGAQITSAGSGTPSKGAIAFGAFSTVPYNAPGVISVDTSETSCGYNSSNYRLLTGLYDPQSAHDAATKGYIDSIVLTNAGAPTTATVGAKGQLLEDTTNGNLYQCTAVSGNTYTWNRILAGAGGTRRATISGWDTSGTLDYVHGQNAATGARGALFYAGTNLSDFPEYVGIGVYADQADLGGYTPYLLAQQVSNDGTGTLSGQTAARRIAVYDEIPATYTTNEWNALWA